MFSIGLYVVCMCILYILVFRLIVLQRSQHLVVPVRISSHFQPFFLPTLFIFKAKLNQVYTSVFFLLKYWCICVIFSAMLVSVLCYTSFSAVLRILLNGNQTKCLII